MVELDNDDIIWHIVETDYCTYERDGLARFYCRVTGQPLIHQFCYKQTCHYHGLNLTEVHPVIGGLSVWLLTWFKPNPHILAALRK